LIAVIVSGGPRQACSSRARLCRLAVGPVLAPIADRALYALDDPRVHRQQPLASVAAVLLVADLGPVVVLVATPG